MIVRDGGDEWHLVLQVDHGDLAGRLARAWGNKEFAPPRRSRSLVIAATRHDDGWAVWERWPRLAEGESRPLSFFEVDVSSHLDFYRAAITDVTNHDRYAGLLVAMHGVGLYRNRYELHPSLSRTPRTHPSPEIDAFVGELEATYPRRIAELELPEDERWTDYKLLQVLDHLSLYFSGLFDPRVSEPHLVSRTPLDYNGSETDLEIVPISPFEPFAPRHVSLKPFPFGTAPAVFALTRRVVPKRSWSSEEFREAFYSTPSETVKILVEPA